MTVAARLAVLIALLAAGVVGPAAATAWAAPGDMQLTISGPDQIAIGQSRSVYTLTAVPQVTIDPASVRVVLTLPAGVTYVSAEPQASGCADRPGDTGCNAGPCLTDTARTVVTCTVSKAAEVYRYTATVAVASTVPVGAVLPISATVTFGDGETTTAQTTATAVLGADLGAEVIGPERPVRPGRPVEYTVVVHNYGPATVTAFAVFGSYDLSWFIGGSAAGGECFSDVGLMTCDFVTTLRPGAERRLTFTMPTLADAALWGTSSRVAVHVNDQPLPESVDETNNRAAFTFSFARRPHHPATTPATPTSSPSSSPAGGNGNGNGNGGDEPGLPITGAAPAPLVASGIVLLLLGTAAIRLTGRRSGRAPRR
jgi:hypothetical protein